MNSPVPSITDDQLDDLQVKRHAALMIIHDQYAQSLDMARRQEIGQLEALTSSLLNIIETGIHDHAAMRAARQIAARRGAYDPIHQ